MNAQVVENKDRAGKAHRSGILMPSLLMFFLYFLLHFLFLNFHEGGHALYALLRGGPVDAFYVHPFILNGYVRPLVFTDEPWAHAAGPVLGILGPLLVFLFTWKRRSIALLPLVMIFPWALILHGINLLEAFGDINNLVQLTGLPPLLFQVLGGVMLLVGIFFFLSLFPLLGVAPGDAKILPVLIAPILLWAGIGLAIAYLLVPGSDFAIRYNLTEELLMGARMGPITSGIMGILLSVLYLTLYRWLYQHLPAWLRSEKVNLTWKDLRLPGLLAAASVIIGFIIIL